MAINLEGAKRAVERLLLVDECTIRTGRDRTGFTHDEDTGVTTPNTATILYAGPCNIGGGQNVAATHEEGGADFQQKRITVSIPVDNALDIRPEDIVSIDAVHTNGNPWLVDREYVVESVEATTYSVLCKIPANLFQEEPRSGGG